MDGVMGTKKHNDMNQELAIKCARFMRRKIRDKEICLDELAKLLKKQGLVYTTTNISGINRRGLFSLRYCLAVCVALGIKTIDIDEILGD